MRAGGVPPVVSAGAIMLGLVLLISASAGVVPGGTAAGLPSSGIGSQIVELRPIAGVSPPWLPPAEPTAASPGGPVRTAAGQEAWKPTGPSQAADPVGVRIPSVGVDAQVIALQTDDEGRLQTPTDFAQTGWWQGGPEPGEPGASVIVGHVDSYEGPAVFFELGDVRAGDRVYVDRADGTTVTFRINGVMSVTKDEFPTRAVYQGSGGAQLRLITCHGDFIDGSYDGNLILFADEVQTA